MPKDMDASVLSDDAADPSPRKTEPRAAASGADGAQTADGAEHSPWRSLLRRVWPARAAADGQAGDNGSLQDEAAQARVFKAAAFDGLRVQDVMVPRADVIAIDLQSNLATVVASFADAAHSRLPVYRDNLDDPIGMVHIKDVVRILAPLLAEGGGGDALSAIEPLTSIMHPILAVPASMRAPDLLLRMQTRRIHMAIVADEFGGTDGLVTLEDLVEAIIGEIEDEHDDASNGYIKPVSPYCWDVDARTEIDELEAVIGRSLKIPETTEEVDTLGGLVFTLIDRVPERGEVVTHPAGLEFEVTDADPRRIKRLAVRMAPSQNVLGDSDVVGGAGSA